MSEEAQTTWRRRAKRGSTALLLATLVGAVVGGAAGAAVSAHWKRAGYNGYSICGQNAAQASSVYPPANGLVWTNMYHYTTCSLSNPDTDGWIELYGELWKKSAAGNYFQCSPTYYEQDPSAGTIGIETGSPDCSTSGYYYALSVHGGYIQGNPYRAADQGYPLLSPLEWFDD